MTTTQNSRNEAKRGVALVIVLGLLAVLTTLAVAFAISMRIERLAAQSFANSVRAEQLIHVSIARAMREIDKSMRFPVTLTYPRWQLAGNYSEALASIGTGGNAPDLLRGEASNAIPRSLTQTNLPVAQWDTLGATGQVAYLAFNTGGLLDANEMGGFTRFWSESLREIDISLVPGVTNVGFFIGWRGAHRRYESVPELFALNQGIDATKARQLFHYSYDPGRDECFLNNILRSQLLGIATTNDLVLKSNVNAILTMPINATNYQYIATPAFIAYKTNIIENLNRAGLNYKPDDVFWNIVNWIDNDRYPQNEPGTRPAYVSTEGGEALPLINEIALLPVVTTNVIPSPNPLFPPTTNFTTNCQAAIEIWYPFVVENEGWTNGGTVNYSLTIDIAPPATPPVFTPTNVVIPPMVFGTPTEFRVFKSAVMPGQSAMVRAAVLDASYPDPVDAAPHRTGGTTGNWSNLVEAMTLTDFRSIEVDDPRSNGKSSYWKPCIAAAGNTLGITNSISDPWGDQWPGTIDRQGLPIYVKNGAMENIGELGYIPLANRENHPAYQVPPNPPSSTVKHYWCSIDLMSTNQGAILLDYLTVYPTNRYGHGYVSINTRDQEVLKALYNNLKIGWANSAFNYYLPLAIASNAAVSNLVNALTSNIIYRTNFTPAKPQGAISYMDLFEDINYNPQGGDVAMRFRDFAVWWENTWRASGNATLRLNDKVREDVFRHTIELISFRQNLYSIVVAAQVTAPNGTVEAEKRALATVYRDSYTGNYFVRSFKWLK